MTRESRHLKISQLSEPIDEQKLLDYFKSYGRVQKLELLNDEAGSVVVSFMDITTASKALGVDHAVAGHPVRASYYEPSSAGLLSNTVIQIHDSDESLSHHGRPSHLSSIAVGGGGGSNNNNNNAISSQQQSQESRRNSGGHGVPNKPYGRSANASSGGWTTGMGGGGPSSSWQESAGYDTGVGGSNGIDTNSQQPRRPLSSGSPASRLGGGGGRYSNERHQSSGGLRDGDDEGGGGGARGSSGDSGRSQKEQKTIVVRNLPRFVTDSSIKDGLFSTYKKHARVVSIKVIGSGSDRYALVTFRRASASKAITATNGEMFFGSKIIVDMAPYGLDGHENERRPLEKDIDQYHSTSSRILYVGNLENRITPEQLKQIFADFGDVLDVDIKNRETPAPFAFVQFADIVSVVKAIHAMEQDGYIGNNKIKVGFGKPLPSPMVWLDELPSHVTEEYLNREMDLYGQITDVLIDSTIRQALITYESIEAAQAAVTDMKGRTINSRKVQIDFCSRELHDLFVDRMFRCQKQANQRGAIGVGGGAQNQPSATCSGSTTPSSSVAGPSSTAAGPGRSSGGAGRKNYDYYGNDNFYNSNSKSGGGGYAQRPHEFGNSSASRDHASGEYNGPSPRGRSISPSEFSASTKHPHRHEELATNYHEDNAGGGGHRGGGTFGQQRVRSSSLSARFGASAFSTSRDSSNNKAKQRRPLAKEISGGSGGTGDRLSAGGSTAKRPHTPPNDQIVSAIDRKSSSAAVKNRKDRGEEDDEEEERVRKKKTDETSTSDDESESSTSHTTSSSSAIPSNKPGSVRNLKWSGASIPTTTAASSVSAANPPPTSYLSAAPVLGASKKGPSPDMNKLQEERDRLLQVLGQISTTDDKKSSLAAANEHIGKLKLAEVFDLESIRAAAESELKTRKSGTDGASKQPESPSAQRRRSITAYDQAERQSDEDEPQERRDPSADLQFRQKKRPAQLRPSTGGSAEPENEHAPISANIKSIDETDQDLDIKVKPEPMDDTSSSALGGTAAHSSTNASSSTATSTKGKGDASGEKLASKVSLSNKTKNIPLECDGDGNLVDPRSDTERKNFPLPNFHKKVVRHGIGGENQQKPEETLSKEHVVVKSEVPFDNGDDGKTRLSSTECASNCRLNHAHHHPPQHLQPSASSSQGPKSNQHPQVQRHASLRQRNSSASDQLSPMISSGDEFSATEEDIRAIGAAAEQKDKEAKERPPASNIDYSKHKVVKKSSVCGVPTSSSAIGDTLLHKASGGVSSRTSAFDYDSQRLLGTLTGTGGSTSTSTTPTMTNDKPWPQTVIPRTPAKNDPTPSTPVSTPTPTSATRPLLPVVTSPPTETVTTTSSAVADSTKQNRPLAIAIPPPPLSSSSTSSGPTPSGGTALSPSGMPLQGIFENKSKTPTGEGVPTMPQQQQLDPRMAARKESSLKSPLATAAVSIGSEISPMITTPTTTRPPPTPTKPAPLSTSLPPPPASKISIGGSSSLAGNRPSGPPSSTTHDSTPTRPPLVQQRSEIRPRISRSANAGSEMKKPPTSRSVDRSYSKGLGLYKIWLKPDEKEKEKRKDVKEKDRKLSSKSRHEPQRTSSVTGSSESTAKKDKERDKDREKDRGKKKRLVSQSSSSSSKHDGKEKSEKSSDKTKMEKSSEKSSSAPTSSSSSSKAMEVKKKLKHQQQLQHQRSLQMASKKKPQDEGGSVKNGSDGSSNSDDESDEGRKIDKKLASSGLAEEPEGLSMYERVKRRSSASYTDPWKQSKSSKAKGTSESSKMDQFELLKEKRAKQKLAGKRSIAATIGEENEDDDEAKGRNAKSGGEEESGSESDASEASEDKRKREEEEEENRRKKSAFKKLQLQKKQKEQQRKGQKSSTDGGSTKKSSDTKDKDKDKKMRLSIADVFSSEGSASENEERERRQRKLQKSTNRDSSENERDSSPKPPKKHLQQQQQPPSKPSSIGGEKSEKIKKKPTGESSKSSGGGDRGRSAEKRAKPTKSSPSPSKRGPGRPPKYAKSDSNDSSNVKKDKPKISTNPSTSKEGKEKKDGGSTSGDIEKKKHKRLDESEEERRERKKRKLEKLAEKEKVKEKLAKQSSASNEESKKTKEDRSDKPSVKRIRTDDSASQSESISAKKRRKISSPVSSPTSSCSNMSALNTNASSSSNTSGLLTKAAMKQVDAPSTILATSPPQHQPPSKLLTKAAMKAVETKSDGGTEKKEIIQSLDNADLSADIVEALKRTREEEMGEKNIDESVEITMQEEVIEATERLDAEEEERAAAAAAVIAIEKKARGRDESETTAAELAESSKMRELSRHDSEEETKRTSTEGATTNEEDKTKPLSVEVDNFPTVDENGHQILSEQKSDVSHVDEIIDDVVHGYVEIDAEKLIKMSNASKAAAAAAAAAASNSTSAAATPQSQQQSSVPDLVGNSVSSVGSAASQSMFHSVPTIPTPPTVSSAHHYHQQQQQLTPSQMLHQPSSVPMPSSCARMGLSPATNRRESSATSSGSSSSGVSQSTDMASGSSTERLNEWTARSPMEGLNARFQALDPTNLRHKLRDTSTKEQNRNVIEKLNAETKLRRDARISPGKPAADDVRDRLRLEGLDLEEKELVEEEEEFPKLTDEQEDILDRVIGRGSEDEVISKGCSIDITRRDLRTLVGLNWLNDEVINFYLQLVMERGGKDGLPSVYVMNTFFYAKIMQSGHSAVRDWTKKADIFEFQLILIPVHLGNHWCLAVVDVPEKLIKYYDSLGGRNPRGLSAIMEYLKAEHVEKKGKAMDLTGWHSMAMTDIPLQENGSDCGMFTLRFAEYVSRDADITFTQANMVYFRRRTIFEIASRALTPTMVTMEQSRLDKLLVLLEAKNSTVRRQAAQQIGDVDRLHPLQLNTLLSRLRRYIKSPSSWDARVAASLAVKEVCRNILATVDDDDGDDDGGRNTGESSRILFAKTIEFDLRALLASDFRLSASEGNEFDVVGQGGGGERQAQRLRVAQQLGFMNPQINDVNEIVTDEDLAYHGGSGGSSNRAAAGKFIDDPIPSKKPKMEQANPSVVDDPKSVLIQFLRSLCIDLYNPNWTCRHGAALTLKEVASTPRFSRLFLVNKSNEMSAPSSFLSPGDILRHVFNVLAIDRFNDFVGEHVVAPVRETCAQLVAAILLSFRHQSSLKLNEIESNSIQSAARSIVKNVLEICVGFFDSSSSAIVVDPKQWEYRHAGLLTVKSVIGVMQNRALFDREDGREFDDHLWAIFDSIVATLDDSNDDIVIAAYQALLPLVNALKAYSPGKIQEAIERCWVLLQKHVGGGGLSSVDSQRQQSIYDSCRDFLSLANVEGADFQQISPATILLNAREAQEICGRALQASIEKRTSMLPANQLQNRFEQLRELIKMNSTQMDRINIRTSSWLACSYVRLGGVPSKFNPIVQPLMNCLKNEANETLVEEAAECLVLLFETTPSCPMSKIVKNLTVIHSWDSKMTPTLAPIAEEPTRILSWDAMSGGDDNSNQRDDASLMAKNAGIALKCLVKHFGEKLDQCFPSFYESLTKELIAAEDVEQGLITSMQILETVYDSLPTPVRDRIREIQAPAMCTNLRHTSAIVRHMSSRCLVVMAVKELVPTFNSILLSCLQLLSKTAASENGEAVTRDHDHGELGATEFVFALVEKLGANLIGAIPLLAVPILAGMSSSMAVVRPVASYTFGQLVRLMPLETDDRTLPGLSDELTKLRRKRLEFLHLLSRPEEVGRQLDLRKRQILESIRLNADLRPYQRDGVVWLRFLAEHGLHGILCDDMGMGKTLQALTALASGMIGDEGTKKRASLIVCPKTLTSHWINEIRKFFDNSGNVTSEGGSVGSTDVLRATSIVDRSAPIDFAKYNVVVAAYDLFRKASSDGCGGSMGTILGYQWNYCILDEGHVIRNPKETEVFRTLTQLKSDHRLILSGTPIKKTELELWALFEFLMPGYLGTLSQFQASFGKPILLSRYAKASSAEAESGQTALENLHKLVLPFVLRRRKCDVLTDLPPKIIQDYPCPLSSLQSRLYDDFSRTIKDRFSPTSDQSGGGGKRASGAFHIVNCLRKLCDHPSLVVDKKHPNYGRVNEQVRGGVFGSCRALDDFRLSGKMIALKQLLSECGIGRQGEAEDEDENRNVHTALGLSCLPRRALIFCQFKAVIALIARYFDAGVFGKSIGYRRLDHKDTAAKRRSIVNRFNDDSSIDVLLLSTQSGGLGLNLTGADVVIFVDHDWNPANDLQAMDSAHRIGQQRTEKIYRLITSGTLEEKMMLRLQQFKTRTADAVIGEENRSLMSMATDQLLDLLTLDGGGDGSAITDGNGDTTRGQKKVGRGSARKDGRGASESGSSAAAIDLPTLWDQSQYDKAFDFDTFINGLSS